MMRRFAQQGYLMIVAVALILIVGFIGVSVAYLFNASSRAGVDHLLADQAFYIAESGLESAGFKLLTPTLTSRTACAAAGATNIAVGKGVYTVTTSGPTYVVSATLNGALTATATTIPVNSTAGYVTTGGRLMIDRELINYTGISGNSFIGVMRGVDGTTAATHVTGVRVGQYQCTLTSQGGVSTLTSPTNRGDPYGKRTLNEGMQLQEAWAVGDNISGSFTFIRWNRPTELQWTNASLSSGANEDLNGISMISYADGWAVGDNDQFLRWNGSTWTAQSVTPRSDYYGVYCSTGNECQAVGDRKSNDPIILRWNGTAWSTPTIVNRTKTNLRSVHCSAASNCWAVGDQNDGKTFYQWNGTSWTSLAIAALNSFPYLGVFCNTSTDCWAVGANATFARKNGASWGTFATGMPAVQYTSVYCNTSTDCWAVGPVNASQDLFVHWNGTAWSRDTSNPTPLANLRGISCANSRDCWAVGVTSVGTSTVFVHWNGTSWTQFTPSGAMPAVALNGVSIVAARTQPQAAWRETIP